MDAIIVEAHLVILLPKVASTSMQKLARTTPGVNDKLNADPYPPLPALAFIRDPVERVWSAALNTGNLNIYPHHMSYKEFIDMTFKTANDHWALQASLLPDIPNLTLHLYEDLNKIWDEKGFPPLPWENTAKTRIRGFKQKIDPTYRYAELLEKYRPDFNLREEITNAVHT